MFVLCVCCCRTSFTLTDDASLTPQMKTELDNMIRTKPAANAAPLTESAKMRFLNGLQGIFGSAKHRPPSAARNAKASAKVAPAAAQTAGAGISSTKGGGGLTMQAVGSIDQVSAIDAWHNQPPGAGAASNRERLKSPLMEVVEIHGNNVPHFVVWNLFAVFHFFGLLFLFTVFFVDISDEHPPHQQHHRRGSGGNGNGFVEAGTAVHAAGKFKGHHKHH